MFYQDPYQNNTHHQKKEYTSPPVTTTKTTEQLIRDLFEGDHLPADIKAMYGGPQGKLFNRLIHMAKCNDNRKNTILVFPSPDELELSLPGTSSGSWGRTTMMESLIVPQRNPDRETAEKGAATSAPAIWFRRPTAPIYTTNDPSETIKRTIQNSLPSIEKFITQYVPKIVSRLPSEYVTTDTLKRLGGELYGGNKYVHRQVEVKHTDDPDPTSDHIPGTVTQTDRDEVFKHLVNNVVKAKSKFLAGDSGFSEHTILNKYNTKLYNSWVSRAMIDQSGIPDHIVESLKHIVFMRCNRAVSLCVIAQPLANSFNLCPVIFSSTDYDDNKSDMSIGSGFSAASVPVLSRRAGPVAAHMRMGGAFAASASLTNRETLNAIIEEYRHVNPDKVNELVSISEIEQSFLPMIVEIFDQIKSGRSVPNEYVEDTESMSIDNFLSNTTHKTEAFATMRVIWCLFAAAYLELHYEKCKGDVERMTYDFRCALDVVMPKKYTADPITDYWRSIVNASQGLPRPESVSCILFVAQAILHQNAFEGARSFFINGGY